MTYEEIKEISSRFEEFDEQIEAVRLDTVTMDTVPNFYYYSVEVNVGIGKNATTVAKLEINENAEESEIYASKCDYDYLTDEERAAQEKIYKTCQGIIKDYLNGTLLKQHI